MKRLLATALAATLALASFAAPALADGHGHGHGHGHANGHAEGHDRAAVHRASARDTHRQNRTTSENGNVYQNGNSDVDGSDQENDAQDGPHGCVNPAGHVRGWCKNANGGTHNGNGYPNGSGQAANQQVSGIVTAVSGTRLTILMGLHSLNVDTSQAYRNGGAANVSIGSTITAYGYYGNDNTFYATRIN